MKTFTNFSSFMECCCHGITSYFGTRLLRSDSVSSPCRCRVLPILLLCLTLFVGVGNAWGQGTESFENLSSTGSYTSQSWTGTNGQTDWAATNARTDNKTAGSRGLTFKASTASTITMKLTSAQQSAGFGVLTFKYKYPYSDSGKSRELSITIGKNTYSSGTLSYTSSATTGTITVNQSLASATVTINVNNGGGRICVDEFSWTACSSCSSKTLSKIEITTQPTTTKYLVGETFSKTGAVVTATYSDATTANVSASATWTPTTGLVSGSNTITASYTEGGVTKTATTTVTGYTVTVQVKDVDGNTLSGGGAPTASATGASITASASGNNYVFKRWVAVTAAGTSFGDANNRSTTLSGTPTGDVTIKAEYHKPINITWNAGGSAYTPGTPGTTQVGYGALMSSLTVPSPAPSTATFCGDKFVGWTTEANVSQDDDTGLNLFTSVAGNTTPITEDMDFYAVFADYDE